MTKLLLPKVETFVLPGAVPLDMVNIPAGTFMMGSTDGCFFYEQPHQVTMAQSFQLGKFVITKAQWQAVMRTTPWARFPCVLDDPNSPAVWVHWHLAQLFIKALNSLTGETFRLPTEAEWEYACRAGTTTHYHFGNRSEDLGDYEWFTDNALDVGQHYAHIVGQKLPNAWGLYDMHGNVSEWCQDCINPVGPRWYGVQRGGSYVSEAYYCRSAYRYEPSIEHGSGSGFRVARSVTGGDGGGRVAARGDQRGLDPEGEVRRHVPSRMAPAVIDASVAGASLADEHRPMTPSQPSCPYRDLVVSGCWGYPELCNLPNGALLVSTSGGRCLEVNPDSGQATPQPDLAAGIPYIGHHLGSPTATATEPVLCCAAMRVVWTDLWQLGASRTSRVTPDGAVNSVALSPQGDLLAVGLGWYPADSSSSPCAAVELFSTADLSRSLARRVLPGVAVDCVMFHPSQNLLVAVTLDCSQIRGHVFLLDRQTLDLIDVAESDGTFCKAVMIDVDAERLLLAHRRGIRVRSLNEFWKVEWAWDTSDDLSSAVHDPERDWVYLSNGQVIAPGFGEVARLPALDKCSGLAILRDGRVAGINGTGVLRVWDVGLLPE